MLRERYRVRVPYPLCHTLVHYALPWRSTRARRASGATRWGTTGILPDPFWDNPERQVSTSNPRTENTVRTRYLSTVFFFSPLEERKNVSTRAPQKNVSTRAPQKNVSTPAHRGTLVRPLSLYPTPIQNVLLGYPYFRTVL